MQAGVIGNDCGLTVHLMGVCGEECHHTFVGVEDHFLGCAPFGDDGESIESRHVRTCMRALPFPHSIVDINTNYLNEISNETNITFHVRSVVGTLNTVDIRYI